MAVYALPTDRPFTTTKPLKRKNSPEVKARLKEGFELLEKLKNGEIIIDAENERMVFLNEEDRKRYEQ